MGCEVYANGDEIACKAGEGKVIAAFPDVCLTPPSPPAGPIPVPYPDTSFSKDMQSGSKTVMIKDQEVMLKDSSFYKTSPLGDEAATNSLGAGVITHVITGKTYFVAWSMDVQFEGQNVDRHSDMTTSNHASPLANVMAPMINLARMALGWIREKLGKCPCCGKAPHSQGTPVSMEQWYTQDNRGNPVPDYKNGFTTSSGRPIKGYDQLMQEVKDRKKNGCTCDGKVVPEPPCNKFYQGTTGGPTGERQKIKDDWNAAAPAYRAKKIRKGKMSPPPATQKVNHKTPKGAGGCPTGDGNLQPHNALCNVCQGLDDAFGDLQGDNRRFR
jgi:hypothetical protein